MIEDNPSPAFSYPTVLQQVRDNMDKYRDCVVLTRVGNFYELYFEQADELGPLLGLKLSSRRAGGKRIGMSGFPFFQLDRYLKALVQDHGKHVAIAEEVANDPSKKVRSGGLLFDRQIRRVITPGTLIDEDFLPPTDNNYLLAVFMRSARVGLAWLDLSSGDFYTQSLDQNQLASAISRITPREVIFEKAMKESQDPVVSSIAAENAFNMTYFDSLKDPMQAEDWKHVLEDTINQPHQSFPSEEQFAMNMVLQYLQSQLPGLDLRLKAPQRWQEKEHMTIDKSTLRALEVTKTLRDGASKGSLLHAVRRTSTESGARMLARRLTSPSMSLDVINDRLDLVEQLMADEQLCSEVRDLLKRTSDTQRLVQKFSFGRGIADDLLRLSQTISVTSQVAHILRESVMKGSVQLRKLVDRFQDEGPRELSERIVGAIDQDGLMKQQRSQQVEAAEVAGQAKEVMGNDAESEEVGALFKRLKSKRFDKPADAEERTQTDDIWIMRRDASSTLSELHDALHALMQEKTNYQSTLQSRYAAPSLALKTSPGLGHHCYVKGKDTKIHFRAEELARPVGLSKTTRTFYLPAWTSLGSRIDDAKLKIRREEQAIFQSLREDVILILNPLRRNAAALDELDVAISFAILADEHELVRPMLDNSTAYDVRQARHLTVESGLTAAGRTFTPNDCMLDDGASKSEAQESSQKIWLITGPNMAGKSTFLRQTALLSILAQTGSFVPAEYARIGLVDAVFSRVGSADNLAHDQSTFMVEMLETAAIVRSATERSLVVMDEVGRGTTPEDGLAVGWAVLKYLGEVCGCRALFATHFHTLADMVNAESNKRDDAGKTNFARTIATYCTRVVEDTDGEGFRFDHRMRPGVNRESHALKVARLAGMPEAAVEWAGAALQSLEKGIPAGVKEMQSSKHVSQARHE
ncbi:MAG: DNA mismatch repair ATPase msh1 [Alyxoria varia]|nr:MAG: DNA mismatch repair ATPase msh1 [Alyxoria varia]